MDKATRLKIILFLIGISAVLFILENKIDKAPSGKEETELLEKKRKSVPKEDRADLAMQQDFERTRSPQTHVIPTDKQFEAIQITRNLLKKKSKIEGVTWQHRGPNNIAGRTRALMFDPNDPFSRKAWAGGVSGGLWYNVDITNADSEWKAVDDFWANLAISDIAYDPSDTQTFYVSTGEGRFNADYVKGAGIWKSTNAGTTWTQLSSTSPTGTYSDYFKAVNAIRINQSGDIFVGVVGKGLQKGAIMRSTDGGLTWTVAFDLYRDTGAIPSSTEVNVGCDIEIAANGDVYISVGSYWNGGIIYRSTDNGDTWVDITPVAGGKRVEIAIAPSASSTTNTTVLYAISNGNLGTTDISWFKKSVNGGQTWTDVNIPFHTDQNCNNTTSHFSNGQAWYDLIAVVHPNNPDFVLLGGINLFRTTDGGNNWMVISSNNETSTCRSYVHADQHAIAFRPNFTNETIFGCDDGVFYASDISHATKPPIESRNKNYSTTQYYTGNWPNIAQSNIIIGGAQDNGILKSERFSSGPAKRVLRGDGGYVFFDEETPNAVIAAYTFNYYYLSTDGGEKFGSALVSESTKGSFVNPCDYDSYSNTLYTNAYIFNKDQVSNKTQLLRVTDILGSPVLTYLPETGSLNINFTHIKKSPHTANRLFLGGNNGKVYQFDAANTATTIDGMVSLDPNNSLPSDVSISSIDVGATDAHLFVTYSNYEATSVWETKDGGASWANKEGNLPDMPIRWGLLNPNNRNQALLATETGVWSCSDISVASPVWEPSNVGLANVRCDMLRFRPADNMVLIATHGRGIYTSDIFVNTTKADFHLEKKLLYQGQSVSYWDGSQRVTNWSWNFGDGASSSEQNPTHTYLAYGIFTPQLTVSDGQGQTNSKSKTIQVLAQKETPYTPGNGGNFESTTDQFGSEVVTGSINLWEKGVPSNTLTTVASGSKAWKTRLNANIDAEDYSCALYTPSFNFNKLNVSFQLSFKLGMEVPSLTCPYNLQVQYSLDKGRKWTLLGTNSDPKGTNWYNLASGAATNEPAWAIDHAGALLGCAYDVSEFAGHSNVAFRFLFTVKNGDTANKYMDGVLIDDFGILETPKPVDFTANYKTVIVGEQVDFTDVSASTATSWLWDFGYNSHAFAPHASYNFNSSGLKTVSLQRNGGSTEVKTNYIQVLPEPTLPYLCDFSDHNGAFKNKTLASVDEQWIWNAGKNQWEVTQTKGDNAAIYTLESPAFDFQKYTPTYIGIHHTGNYSAGSGFNIHYSEDGGSTWKILNNTTATNWYTHSTLAGLTNANNVTSSQAGFGVSNSTINASYISLSTLAGKANIIFRIVLGTSAPVNTECAILQFEIGGTSNTTSNGTWLGTTSNNWFLATNWQGNTVPTENTNVIIKSTAPNQPVIGTSQKGKCARLTIETGASLTIQAGSSLQAYARTSNDGTLSLEASATLMASFLDNGQLSGSGIYSIQAFTKSGIFRSFANPTYTQQPGFSGAYAQTYDETSNSFKYMTKATGGAMNTGTGYMVGWSPTNQAYSITGLFHTGPLSYIMPLNNQGWFFAGNPYSSFIDWDASSSEAWAHTSVGTAIYLWQGDNYGVYVKNSGLGTNGATNSISPTEAFFIRNLVADNPFYFDNSVRTSDKVASKKANFSNILKVRVQGKSSSDELLLEIKRNSESQLLNAPKLFSTRNDVPQLYFEDDNLKLSICSLHPTGDAFTVPINFVQGGEENYQLQFSKLESFEDYNIKLYDKLNDNYTDLIQVSQYNFITSDHDSNRFELQFYKKSTPESSGTGNVKFYVREKELFIFETKGEPINGQVEMFSLAGQRVFQKQLIGQSSYSIPLHQDTGIYLIRCATHEGSWVKRIAIK